MQLAWVVTTFMRRSKMEPQNMTGPSYSFGLCNLIWDRRSWMVVLKASNVDFGGSWFDYLDWYRTQVTWMGRSSSSFTLWRMQFWTCHQARSKWYGWLISMAGVSSIPLLSKLLVKLPISYKITTLSGYMLESFSTHHVFFKHSWQ